MATVGGLLMMLCKWYTKTTTAKNALNWIAAEKITCPFTGRTVAQKGTAIGVNLHEELKAIMPDHTIRIKTVLYA